MRMICPKSYLIGSLDSNKQCENHKPFNGQVKIKNFLVGLLDSDKQCEIHKPHKESFCCRVLTVVVAIFEIFINLLTIRDG